MMLYWTFYSMCVCVCACAYIHTYIHVRVQVLYIPVALVLQTFAVMSIASLPRFLI